MWGAVIGDIIGSTFEHENSRSPFFELFVSGSRFTDDTVCTGAVAYILKTYSLENLTDDLISDEIRLWCCAFLNRGFGSLFYQWIGNGVNLPYGSYGNGALMRISPVALYGVRNNMSLAQTLELAKKFTQITHNHPQALNAVSMYIDVLYTLLAQKHSLDQAKELITKKFEEYKIAAPKKINEYRINLDFDLTCNHSIGVACAAILETSSFDDVMYQVVSAGGDSDTYATIAGAIAEAIYGIPQKYMQKAKTYFRPYDQELLFALESQYQ